MAILGRVTNCVGLRNVMLPEREYLNLNAD